MKLPLRAWRGAQTPKATQRRVARLAGLGLYRYWEIENGEGPVPTADEKSDVAKALGVKVSDIAWPDVVPRVRLQPVREARA